MLAWTIQASKIFRMILFADSMCTSVNERRVRQRGNAMQKTHQTEQAMSISEKHWFP